MSLRTFRGVRVPAAALALLEQAVANGAEVTQDSADRLRITVPGQPTPIYWGWRRGSDSPAHVSNLRTTLRRAGALTPESAPADDSTPSQEDTPMPRTRNHGATVAPERAGSRATAVLPDRVIDVHRLDQAVTARAIRTDLRGKAERDEFSALPAMERAQVLSDVLRGALVDVHGMLPSHATLTAALAAQVVLWGDAHPTVQQADIETALALAETAQAERDAALAAQERAEAALERATAEAERLVEQARAAQRRAEKERDDLRVAQAEALERATKAERRLAAFRSALLED